MFILWFISFMDQTFGGLTTTVNYAEDKKVQKDFFPTFFLEGL